MKIITVLSLGGMVYMFAYAVYMGVYHKADLVPNWYIPLFFALVAVGIVSSTERFK